MISLNALKRSENWSRCFLYTLVIGSTFSIAATEASIIMLYLIGLGRLIWRKQLPALRDGMLQIILAYMAIAVLASWLAGYGADLLMALRTRGETVEEYAAAAAVMRETCGEDGAEIVNVGSIAGLKATGSCMPYAASKAALHNLTVALARTLAPKIRVNAVAPGFITGRWLQEGLGEEGYEATKAAFEKAMPLQAVCDPEDVAKAIVSLVEGSDLVTGQILGCDGGMIKFLEPVHPSPKIGRHVHRSTDLAAKNHNRDSVYVARHHPGYEIREAWASRDDRARRAPSGLEIAVGREACRLLIQHRHKVC